MRADGQLAKEAHDHDAAGDANQRFHAIIVEGAGSAFADEMMTRVLALMRLFFVQVSDEHNEFHYPYVELNEEVLKLVEAGQREQAAEKMRMYLEKSRIELRELLSGPAVTDDAPSATGEMAGESTDERS